jgi:hypothetical protein
MIIRVVRPTIHPGKEPEEVTTMDPPAAILERFARPSQRR